MLLEFLSQFLLQPDPVQRPPIASSTPLTRTEPSVIPAARNEPIGLKASDFLPVSISGQKFPASVCIKRHQKRGPLKCRSVLGAFCSLQSSVLNKNMLPPAFLLLAWCFPCKLTLLPPNCFDLQFLWNYHLRIAGPSPIVNDSRLMRTQQP